MCGVQCRSTFHAGLDINLFIHLSFRQGGDWTCCCVVWCKKLLYNIQLFIIHIPLLQRIRQMMLTSAYWLLSLHILDSKYNTDPLRQKKALYLTFFSKMSRNVHVLCSCRMQSLPHCWLQIIYNWANNSLTSKEYEQNVHMWLHAALAFTTAVKTIQFKVNVLDPYMAMV